MNPNETPATFWLLVIISAFLILLFRGREVYQFMRFTEQQRKHNEASRIMLRFCKNPTRANWEDAWSFIHCNEVLLSELDWPLVQRFTRTAVSVNFSPEMN